MGWRPRFRVLEVRESEVRRFLINNALFFLEEYHADGFRYDEVSVIDRFGGWYFCRDLTDTLHFVRPSALNNAEYWPVKSELVTPTAQGGAGFDVMQHDGIRESVRSAIAQAARGRNASVDMDRVARSLYPSGFADGWRAVTCVENHDIVKRGEQDRIARLGDSFDTRSWYARSRARVATGLLLTAPGIPMLFMGQEFLEDKQWSDDPASGHLIWWQGIEDGDRAGRWWIIYVSRAN